MTIVRAMTEPDFTAWTELWGSYLHFYRADGEVAEAVTEATFSRLVERRDGLAGLVAEDGSRLVGFAHLVFHPSTWDIAPYCYLEDLFVSAAARGTGAARLLIESVYEEADRHGASRTYWETQEFNSPARSLYDKVAHRTSFIVYER